MKSKLFSRFDPTSEKNKEFRNDLKSLLSLDFEKITKIADNVVKMYISKSPKESTKVIDDLSSELTIEATKIGGAIELLIFLMDQINDETLSGDTKELWLEDLNNIGLIDGNQNKKFLDILDHIWEIAGKEYKKADKEKAYKTGVLPYIKSMGYTVELRGIFNDEYEYGENLGSFKPEIVDFVPIISVGITLETDKQKSRIVFQAEEDQLNRVIDVLKSAIIEAELIKVKKERI